MYTTYKVKDGEKFVGAANVVVLQNTKTCLCCGKAWIRVPAIGVQNEMGYWWNCNCGSTMHVPEKKVA